MTTTETVSIHLNDQSRVILTERGVEAVRDYYRSLSPDQLAAIHPVVESGRPLDATLWQVMAMFGPLMCMGNEPPICSRFDIRPGI